MSMYLGVAGKARQVKQMYFGVSGKARRVTKAYIGVGGKARLFYTSNAHLIKDIPTTVGQTCTWAGHNWTIVHITDSLIYMILTNIYSLCYYGPYARYYDSTIYSKCIEFLNTLDNTYKSVLQDITVNGITCKVFVPNVEMAATGVSNKNYDIYPTFEYFNSKYTNDYSNRKALYNGSAKTWWLSDPFGDGAWVVSSRGRVQADNLDGNYGFRPCIAVKRK